LKKILNLANIPHYPTPALTFFAFEQPKKFIGPSAAAAGSTLLDSPFAAAPAYTFTAS